MKGEGYLTAMYNKMKADAFAAADEADRAKAIRADRQYWFALASGDPDHLEFYAIAGGYDQGFLRGFLDSAVGAKLGIAFDAQLQRNGELERWKALWVLPEALALIKRHIAGESVSVVIKFMEGVGKQTENRELVYIPPFEGSAADLIAELTDGAQCRISLPFTKSKAG
jgi:hypothetical protein